MRLLPWVPCVLLVGLTEFFEYLKVKALINSRWHNVFLTDGYIWLTTCLCYSQYQVLYQFRQKKKSFLYYYFFSSSTWTPRLATAIVVLSVSKKQAIEPIEFQYCSLFLFGCPLPLGIIRHHPTLSSAAHSASQYFWPSLRNRDNLVWHCFWLPCLPYTSLSSPMMEASKNIVSKLSVCKSSEFTGIVLLVRLRCRITLGNRCLCHFFGV